MSHNNCVEIAIRGIKFEDISKKIFPPDQARKFLEPGPIVLVSSAQQAPPLIKECYANFECQLIDTKMVNKYSLFILQL